jgi:hypothetical protein
MSTPTPAAVPARATPDPTVNVRPADYRGVMGAQVQIGQAFFWVPFEKLERLTEQGIDALNYIEARA